MLIMMLLYGMYNILTEVDGLAQRNHKEVQLFNKHISTFTQNDTRPIFLALWILHSKFCSEVGNNLKVMKQVQKGLGGLEHQRFSKSRL